MKNKAAIPVATLELLIASIAILSFQLAGPGFAQGPVFVSSESTHLVVYYVKGTAAQRDLSRIIADREKAFAQISDLLKAAPEKKLAVYLYPTRESTQSGQGTGHALNDGAGVSVNYFDFSPSFERTHYGHELTHAIAFRLAGRHQDLPILSEGLAEYLDQSGRDMHDAAASCARINGLRRALRVEPESDLVYSHWPGRCGYEKAGSFVRFLVETYGWEKFRSLYKATAQATHDFPDARLGGFESWLEAVYAAPLEALESRWNAALSPHFKGPLPRLGAEDEAAVQELFAKQDQAAAGHDSAAIEQSYDVLAKRSIARFRGNLKYYADLLQRTEISEIYDLGIKNGPSALALTTRHFGNGRSFRISYQLEKLDQGWKIQEEEWLH